MQQRCWRRTPRQPDGLFFFFQAEDGIRDDLVTGVQTCALPISTVGKSALEAKEMGYLRPSDVVVMHAHEILHVAKNQARALADAGYRPPLAARNIPVVEIGRASCRERV